MSRDNFCPYRIKDTNGNLWMCQKEPHSLNENHLLPMSPVGIGKLIIPVGDWFWPVPVGNTSGYIQEVCPAKIEGTTLSNLDLWGLPEDENS